MQDVMDLNTELTGYFGALADNVNIRYGTFRRTLEQSYNKDDILIRY
jgi:hypothetical protein